MMARSTEGWEIDEKLVELLPVYKCIWDRSSDSFKNKYKKDAAFRELAVLLGTSVETVQRRYRAVRERYRKIKIKQGHQSTVHPYKKYSPSWKLAEDLTFLDDFILPRKCVYETEDNDDMYYEYNDDTTSHGSDSIIQKITFEIEPPPEVDPQSSEEYVSYPNTPEMKNEYSLENIPSFNKPTNSIIINETSKSHVARPSSRRRNHSRFEWIAKFIGETLNEMDENLADEAVEELIQLLLRKKRQHSQ